MEVYIDTLCLLAQPKEGQQQFKDKKTTKTDRKSKPHRSLTTKEIKKKHSSRPVGGAETGSQDRRDSWRQLADSAAPHSHIDNREERQGVKWTAQPRATALGNKASNL